MNRRFPAVDRRELQ